MLLGARFESIKTHFISNFLSLLHASFQDVSSQLPAPGAMPVTGSHIFLSPWAHNPLEPYAQIKSSFCELLWSWCSVIAADSN